MNKPLMWRLCLTIAAGTVLLFWAVDVLTKRTEHRMSYIEEIHQQSLKQMGETAERILALEGDEALSQWVEQLKEKEQTWIAVVKADVDPQFGSKLPQRYIENFRLGRSVDWKIHLYFKENPIMDVTFEGGVFSERNLHFLVQLPQRMRPGAYLQYTHWILQLFLPLILLIIVSLILYRHVMRPLQQLEKATRQFSKGNYQVRVRNLLGNRNDEIAALADTFDGMTSKIGTLIITQRQLIADLSHELRTPLARLDMAVDCIASGINSDDSLERLRKESITMRQLVEDTLTLAWLENEKPCLNDEEVDLIELLELLVDDARFEYSDRQIETQFPDAVILPKSSHRALAQALENIIRNALRYTPKQGSVTILVKQSDDTCYLQITDQGPGVPEEHLTNIFRPFFRVEKARRQQHSQAEQDASSESKTGGYGLGLALARRQIEAVGGSIEARNAQEGGLRIRIWL